jgi:dipeptidase E
MDIMKPSILIYGGGKSPDVDMVFFKSIPKNGKILLCPLASENIPATISSRKEWLSDNVTDVTMDFLSVENSKSINLLDYDALVITGGSTYLLQRLLFETGLNQKIKGYVTSGGLVYGGSAGAMVLSKDIDNCRPEDNPELGQGVSTEGLDLLGGFCVAPHWPLVSDFVRQFHKDTGYNLICLPENTGAWFSNNGKLIETFGKGIEFIGDMNSQQIQ